MSRTFRPCGRSHSRSQNAEPEEKPSWAECTQPIRIRRTTQLYRMTGSKGLEALAPWRATGNRQSPGSENVKGKVGPQPLSREVEKEPLRTNQRRTEFWNTVVAEAREVFQHREMRLDLLCLRFRTHVRNGNDIFHSDQLP